MARNEEQEKKKVSRKHNMRKQTKRMLIGVMIMVSLITTGCTTSASREEELREHFREISDRYPTENLMDLLVEGEIHQLNSDLSLYVDGKKRSEAMVLLFNGREGKITGQYQITIYGEEKFESSTHYGYNIAYTEEGVQLLEEVADEELKERILSFRPMIQYLDLNQEY
ncbi:MAG: Csa1 family protein, partial [Eubacteriales bacterium]